LDGRFSGIARGNAVQWAGRESGPCFQPPRTSCGKDRTEHPVKLDVLFWDEISSLEEKNRKIEAVDSNWNNMAH
jgi:hypothetical protein